MHGDKEMLKQKIGDSEMVLVGIGSEFFLPLDKMEEIPEYQKAMEDMRAREDIEWMKPFIESIYFREHKEKRIADAYKALELMLENKDYFIVSLCTDDYIFQSGIDKNRIVMPCGSNQRLQCTDACGVLQLVNTAVERQIMEYLIGERVFEDVEKPACPECGRDMVCNRIENRPYTEGYLEQWKLYTSWLQATLNRRICVLELGVGMEYPSVIRWPFEKAAYFNQKAFFFRIHNKLFHLAEELKDRGYSINKNSVDFLAN